MAVKMVLSIHCIFRMNCKCGHDFCWKCQKPWRPTHTDYFSCSATVSTVHVWVPQPSKGQCSNVVDGPFAMRIVKFSFLISFSFSSSLSEQISKGARDAKKFVDYNQRCASYHRSKVINLTDCIWQTSWMPCMCMCVLVTKWPFSLPSL